MCESGCSCEENFVQTKKPKVAAVATKKPYYLTRKSLLAQCRVDVLYEAKFSLRKK